ncbi:MAG: SiaB family protein kinase [Bacteroidota bacterium]
MNLQENKNPSFIFDLYRQMNHYSLSYIYRGGFSIDLSNKILSLAETNMENFSESSSTKKKVYFIMLESLQNITRHQDVKTQESTDNSSFFVIQRLENDYYITSGNIIENKNIDSLKSKLSKVNSLDKESLKEYYKEILAQGELSKKGGAGLGLIEMARKSGNKLSYDFKEIDTELSNFYFQIKVSVPEVEPGFKDINIDRLTWIEGLEKLILEKNLNLIYQVDFTQESLISILSMTEGNIGNKQDLALRKKIFNIIVELSQNIYKHADEPETGKEGKSGILMLGEKNGEYTLTTGNLILNKRIESLSASLDKVNEANFEELDTLFDKTIMEDEKKGQKGAGLGFIDIKMKSRNNLTYHFNQIDADYSFFEIQVKVSEKQ